MIAGVILAALLAGPAQAKDRVKLWASELDGADLPRQIVAARALGRSGKAEAVDPLLNRLDARRASPRLTAVIVEALGRLHDPRALEPLITVWDYLNSVKLQLAGEMPANLQVLRGAVVDAVGELGDKKGATLLEEALGDKDPAVAQKAAVAVGKVGDIQSVEALLTMLQRGGNYTQAAGEGLGRLGDPRGVNALQGLLKSEDATTQVEAAYALSLRDTKWQPTLAGYMREETRETADRILAAYYLARLGSDAGLDFLGRLAQKGKPGDQLHAIEALGKSQNPRAAGRLLDAARSPAAETRLLCAQALGRLGGPKAESALKKLLEDRSPQVKGAARIALGELGEI
jgi:HEAT repeat protein